jgi:hypothetical protein
LVVFFFVLSRERKCQFDVEDDVEIGDQVILLGRLFFCFIKGEKMSIKSYEDFAPRATTVHVGDKSLHVEELVAVKRDALVRIILDEADVVRLFGPFIRGLGKMFGASESEEVEVENDDNDHEFEEVFGEVKKSIMNILGKNLTRVSCVVLDTEKNRRIVGIENNEQVEDADGILHSSEMHGWIKSHLTLRQEQAMISALITTNDFVGLVKNYMTLVTSVTGAIQTQVENEK